MAAPIPVKIQCLLLFAKKFSQFYEIQQLILGISYAIQWMMEPYLLLVLRQPQSNSIFVNKILQGHFEYRPTVLFHFGRWYCCQLKMIPMEQHILYHFNDYRGHHRKGIAIYTATLKSINIKNVGFYSTKNVFLNITERLKQEKFN